jgi:hypothetical protein
MSSHRKKMKKGKKEENVKKGRKRNDRIIEGKKVT